MPEDVKLPAIGNVKKEYVMLGGGLVVGLVGYAWWHQRARSDVPVVVDPNLIPETDRTPVVQDSTQHVDTTAPDTIGDTASWTRHATDYLMTQGWEAQAVATALGHWIAHQPLTSTEIDIVNAARAAFGDPPTGGPYPVTHGLPNPTVPGTVSGLHVVSVSGHSVTIAWDAVPGATSYYLTCAEPTGPTPRIPDRSTSDKQFTWAPLGPNIDYTFTVAAQNSAGKGGASTVHGKTTP